MFACLTMLQMNLHTQIVADLNPIEISDAL